MNSFNFLNLIPEVREKMLKEVEKDINEGKLYRSERITDFGWENYERCLKVAVTTGTPETLISLLRASGFWKGTEISHTKDGRELVKAVPHTAVETYANGEFNVFYMRGLCAYLLSKRQEKAQVYRARAVNEPRSRVEHNEGDIVNCVAILEELRDRDAYRTKSNLGAPNSGLSLKEIVYERV